MKQGTEIRQVTNIVNKMTISKARNIIQTIFSLYLLYLGWAFYHFVKYFQTQGVAINGAPVRSAAVEGFLPIYALMSLKGWLSTGIFDTLHPAALVIFLAIIATAFFARKGFCSWLCPVGAISEGVSKIGKLIFKKNYSLPKYLHYPLMVIKYALLVFFVYFIFGMPGDMIPVITQGDYYKIADVKMLYFFLDLSKTAIIVITILVAVSLFIKNFWCKYLCPYGALLGIAGFLSPVGIKRDKNLCIECGKCNQACPSDINIMGTNRVNSPECTACMNCVSSCPKKDAIGVKVFGNIKFDEWYLLLLILVIFFGFIFIAQVTGHWNTGISLFDYSRLIPYAKELSQ